MILALGGNDLNPLIVYVMGRIYVCQSMYAVNGGVLLRTAGGEVYINPDGREMR